MRTRLSARTVRLLPVYVIAGLAVVVAPILFLVAGRSPAAVHPVASPAPLTNVPITADAIPVKGVVLPHPEKVLSGPLPKHPIKLPTGLRVVIPAIGVDAEMLKLGLNTDGTLQVPADVHLTGWWGGGPFPGDPGPAVVVGHVDNYKGPGVFYHLRNLKQGDWVYVSRPDGRVAIFQVDSMTEAPKDHFPTDRVYGAIHGAGLRLITCGGAFNHAIGHYVDNVIVFAHLAGIVTS